MTKRTTGARRRMALASPMIGGALLLAGCGAKTPPPIANIPVPLPQNVAIVPPPPPPPPGLINRAKGEDMWHLRSGLNVAVLLCQGPDNAAMVASYNRLLTTHKGLLAAAAQETVDLYKAMGGKKWQSVYDDRMTKVYNGYSGTLTRDAFCSASKAILSEAEFATPVAFTDRATAMLWELNKAAGLPDPDGQLARAGASTSPAPVSSPTQSTVTTTASRTP